MPATWTVPSQSNPSVKYTVVFDGEGFSCNCPNFTYRRRECKHVYAVKLSEGLLKADIQPVKPAEQHVEALPEQLREVLGSQPKEVKTLLARRPDSEKTYISILVGCVELFGL